MKRATTLFFLAFTVCVLALARNARAATEQLQNRFASDVELDVLRTVACDLRPTLTLDGRDRPIEVSVASQRCTTTVVAVDSIRLAVRIEPGEPRSVVLEMEVPDGTSAETLRSSLAEIGSTLRIRVMRATLPPITVVEHATTIIATSAPDPSPRTIDVRSFATPKISWQSATHGVVSVTVKVIVGVLGAALVAGAVCLGAAFVQSFANPRFY